MCGRFYLDVDFDDILDRYGYLIFDEDYQRKKELFPTNKVAVITSEPKQLRLSYMDWGFTPTYAKRPIINARSESIFEKPLFKKAIQKSRCLVPARGYFEWLKSDGQKIKHRITLADQGIFSMAGIYQILKTDQGTSYCQVSILTREAAPEIAWLHDRMPLILPPETEKEYLHPRLNESDIQALLQTAVLHSIDVLPEGDQQLSFL